MTTGKTIALTIQTFVGKVMSLLLNTRSMFVIALLPRSKHLAWRILGMEEPGGLPSLGLHRVGLPGCVREYGVPAGWERKQLERQVGCPCK